MSTNPQMLEFYLTGRGLPTIGGLDLLPVEMAPYRKLGGLRHDFPMVLCDDGPAKPLAAIVDAQGLEPGEDRFRALRIESEIRRQVGLGKRGRLSDLWRRASAGLDSDATGTVVPNIVDGDVVPCDADFPQRYLEHAFSRNQAAKAAALRRRIARLIVRLEDILRSDDVLGPNGRTPQSLRAGVGTAHAATFDFEVMANLLTEAAPNAMLSVTRRDRIERTLKVLKCQRFVALDGDNAPDEVGPYGFEFSSCRNALEAYRERLPAAIELTAAMSVAALEAEGEYEEAKHNRLFEGQRSPVVDSDALAAMPDYLICVDATHLGGRDTEELLAFLAAGMSFKVVAVFRDLLVPHPAFDGNWEWSQKPVTLTSGAAALASVYVLQSSASALHGVRELVDAGLQAPGPALFSIYSGPTAREEVKAGRRTLIDAYLRAAAAVEARVFPTFVFVPDGLPDKGGARFGVTGNPAERDTWPLHRIRVEDSDHGRQDQESRFTPLQFLVLDGRLSSHFAICPDDADSNDLSAPEALQGAHSGELPTKLPAFAVANPEGKVYRLLAQESMIRLMRDVEARWTMLREQSGIENPLARLLLDESNAAWQAKLDALEARLSSAPLPAISTQVPKESGPEVPELETNEATVSEEAAPPPSDEPWIESARCTTCNECTLINGKMFAYNENRQAYIADPLAGTYAQLVEAAENCQVSIIHPGKPKNPKEPGLDDLSKRAAVFL